MAADWDGPAADEYLRLGEGQWFKRVATSGFDWTEARPYEQLFPTDSNPPVITGLRPNAQQDEMTLFIDATGIGKVEIYYKDLAATNVFASTGWQIAATNITGNGNIQWTDAGSSGRGKVDTVYARYYLVGNSCLDTDHDGLPDSLETFVLGTDPNTSDAAGAMLIRLDFGPNGTTARADGTEAMAITADSTAFGSSGDNKWDARMVPRHGTFDVYTFSDLKETSTGGVTGVSITWGDSTHKISSYDTGWGVPQGGDTKDQDLFSDYLVIGAGGSTPVPYTITGLQPNTATKLLFYAVHTRNFSITAGSDTGHWFSETNIHTHGNSFVAGAVLLTTTTDGSGNISGSWASESSGNESDLAGMQIYQASAGSSTNSSGPSAPTVSNASGATNVTSSSAHLSGNLTSTGGATTGVRLYWGATDGGTDASSWDHIVDMGELAEGAFSSQVTGLDASTIYYYRSYATNSSGASWASASTNFTTSAGSSGGSSGVSIGVQFAVYSQNSTYDLAADENPFAGLGGNGGGGNFNLIRGIGNSGYTSGALTNSTGSSVDNVTFSIAAGLWAGQQGVNNYTPTNAFDKLGNGGLRIYDYYPSSNSASVTVSGIPYSSYDVFVMVMRGNSDGTKGGWVGLNGDSSTRRWAKNTGIMPWQSRPPIETTGTTFGTQTTDGNWAHWSGVAGSTLTIDLSSYNTDDTHFYNQLMAFQIVDTGSSSAPTAPTISNAEGATNVTSSSTYLCGNLTSTGGATTDVRLYWGTTDGGTTASAWDHVIDMGNLCAGEFSSPITGLSESTTYYYRSYATNSSSQTWASGSTNLTTASAGVSPPTIANSEATNITSSSVYPSGNLTSTGGASTIVSLYWGPTDGGTDKSAWANVLNIGVLSSGTFSSQITGIAPSTTYYYRCYATNSAGASWASASTNFTSLAAASSQGVGILIRLDFGSVSHPEYKAVVGTVESVAAGADPVFGSSGSNVWDYRADAAGTYLNLKDTLDGSAGTAVGLIFDSPFNWTGTAGDGADGINLRRDYLGSYGADKSFVITNLQPNTETRLFFYGTEHWNAPYRVRIGDGTPVLVTAGTATNGAEVVGTTDASGMLTGTVIRALDINPDAVELDIAGLQIYQPDTVLRVRNGNAVGIGATAVSFVGYLAGTGGAPANVWLCWGTNDCGTSEWPNVEDLGVKPRGGLLKDLSGLSYTNTTYYYRYFASNSFGTAWATPTASFGGTLDTDGNGMPDGWQMLYFGHTGVDPKGDADGDGLANLQEYRAGTRPDAIDTDGDGVSDSAEVIQAHSNPLVADFNGEVTTVQTIPASTATNFVGMWAADGDDMICSDRRGWAEYTITSPTGDIYRIEVEGTSVMDIDYSAPFELAAYVNGELLSRETLSVKTGTNSVVQYFTPWLPAGSYTLRMFLDNAKTDTGLKLRAVRVQTMGGYDNNANGIKDWVETSLGNTCSLETSPGTPAGVNIESLVSPVCLEGRGRFVTMMTNWITAGDQTVSASTKPGINDRWYADMPLSATGSTQVAVSFQNGGKTVTSTVMWSQLNLLTAGTQMIRKGDSLLFTAKPQGATNGMVMIEIGGTNYQTSVNAPVEYLFGLTGTYTVTGIYDAEQGQSQTGTVEVTVVGAEFPTNSPIAWVGKSRTWDCPGMDQTAVIDADSRLSNSVASLAGGGIRMTLTTESNDPRFVVARLGTNGHVLASASIDGFRFFSSASRAVAIIQTYEDGSQLVEERITVSRPHPGLEMRLTIFVGGVTFSDGTTTKTLGPGDFTAIDEYYSRMLRAAGVTASICHSTQFYQDEVFIGEYQNSDADRF